VGVGRSSGQFFFRCRPRRGAGETTVLSCFKKSRWFTPRCLFSFFSLSLPLSVPVPVAVGVVFACVFFGRSPFPGASMPRRCQRFFAACTTPFFVLCRDACLRGFTGCLARPFFFPPVRKSLVVSPIHFHHCMASLPSPLGPTPRGPPAQCGMSTFILSGRAFAFCHFFAPIVAVLLRLFFAFFASPHPSRFRSGVVSPPILLSLLVHPGSSLWFGGADSVSLHGLLPFVSPF